MRVAVGSMVLIGTLGAGLAWELCRASGPGRGTVSGTVLDAREIPFREDESVEHPRVLAWIRCEVRSCDGGRVELVLRASASHPLVEPAPGWEGIRGANAITARELGALLDEGLVELVTSGPALAGPRRSPAVAGARGHLPRRGFFPDGALDWNAGAAEQSVLELVLGSGPLEPGAYRSEIVARGRPRLTVEWDGQRVRVLRLEQGAGHAEP